MKDKNRTRENRGFKIAKLRSKGEENTFRKKMARYVTN